MGADSWDSTRHRAMFNDVTNYNQRVATTNAVSLTPLVCLEACTFTILHSEWFIGQERSVHCVTVN